MNSRQEILLKNLVETYISTAEPIGSKTLAATRGLHISPATIRNECMELEDAGYITQPHTSAGRIPTVQGISYYVEHLMEPITISTTDAHRLRSLLRTHGFHGVARDIAHHANAALLVASGKNDLYITGISNLFPDPERRNPFIVQSISHAVDHLEETIPELYECTKEMQAIMLVGKSNPLGNECVIACARTNWRSMDTLIGMITPLRTNYGKNMGLMRAVATIFQ